MKTLIALVTALPMTILADAAAAGSANYSGSWKVTLTHSMHVTNDGYQPGPNSTQCVVLTDDGSGGRPHSGGVLVNGTYSGQFEVTGSFILIAVGVPGGNGEDSTWVFSSTASEGKIASKGTYVETEGGETYVVANATFAAKGGC
jgi:hypothetical protein